MYIIIDKIERVVCGGGHEERDRTHGWYLIGRIVGYIIQFAIGLGLGMFIKAIFCAIF